MSRPGVEVISRAEPLPRTAPTDTGPWFVAGATAKGPANDPQLIRSLTEYVNVYGDRQGGPVLYDHAEAFFREGGAMLWVSAIPTTPTTLEAAVAYVPAADRRVEMAVEAASSSSSSSTKATKAGAEVLAAPLPADLVNALNLFTTDYGPGQVSIPGAHDATSQSAILAHAAAHNRVALLDVAATQTKAQLTATAAGLRTDTNARYGALFGPQAIIPGVAGGTTRSVGYSAVEAGIIARNDATLNQNQAAAGEWGQAVYALDVDARYSDQDYEDLNEAGIDMARLIYGGVRTYGYRSLVDPSGPAGQWRDFGWCRLNMAIVAQSEVIGQRYVFSQIDGRGHTIAEFGADLRAMLVPMYEADALYGATPDDAFQVHVDSRVNTPATIANGELHAVIQVRMSPFSEWVVIEIVKVSTLQALAA